MKRKVIAMALMVVTGSAGLKLAAVADAPDAPATQPAADQRPASLVLQRLIDKRLALQAQMARTTAELAVQEARLAQQQQAMREATGRTEVASTQLHDAAANLDAQEETLRLAQVGTQAQCDAIADQIEQLEKKIAEKVDADDAVAALQKVVAARQNQLNMLESLMKSGISTPNDVNNAQATLADAQAQVVLERNRATTAAGGDIMISLQKELIEQTIKLREQDAQLKYLGEQLQRLGRSVPDLTKQDDMRVRIAELHAQLSKLQADLGELGVAIEDAQREMR